MTTTVTSVFNDSLDTTNGSRSDAFTNADYAIVIAPLIEGVGDDFQVDTFLQLEFNNRNRLIPLEPINLLDTNNISIIPFPFKAGNEFNLYFFMLASQPVNVEVLVAKNEDDNWQEIKDKLEEIQQTANTNRNLATTNLALNTTDTAVQALDVGIDLIGLLLPVVPAPLPSLPLPLPTLPK